MGLTEEDVWYILLIVGFILLMGLVMGFALDYLLDSFAQRVAEEVQQ